MAGPWFTVQQTGSDWETLDRIWLSNGDRDDPAQVQVRLRLEEPDETKIAAAH